MITLLKTVPHDPALKARLEAALRVAENNQCALDFDELVELQGLGIKIKLTA